MADTRAPVVIDLSLARHALYLASQRERTEPRGQVLARFVADTRAGFHRVQLRPRLAPGARA
ncbi:hypothetical protein CMZ84_04380 [Lysobacteraceae bacterium NML93-0399]|nr:hypothetical protein CMZ84_04380 [Xanthomonadaceae bacterium NML93-0399]